MTSASRTAAAQALAALSLAALPSAAAAQPVVTADECTRLGLFCADGPGIGTVAAVLYNAALAILVLLSVVAFIVMVYCGAQYITSSGDQQRASRAKMCLLYALVGIIIAGLAGWIVNSFINVGRPPSP